MTSLDKHGQGLFAFTPAVDPYGIFTNDALFKESSGLTIPETFSQLLTVCQKAKAGGTAAIVLGAASPFTQLILDLAVATVYGKDKTWPAELRAGKVTFDGTAGWHQALQEFVDMSNAGCFQPGATGTGAGTALANFAQGRSLMTPTLSSFKGTIDTSSPQFSYSFHLFPGGTSPTQTRTLVNLAGSLSINAHSSAANQAAAKTFIDFIARPKQNALYAQIIGGLTQYEILKQQVPGFMSDLATMLKDHAYVVNPSQTWWNPDVLIAGARCGRADHGPVDRRRPERDGRRLEPGPLVVRFRSGGHLRLAASAPAVVLLARGLGSSARPRRGLRTTTCSRSSTRSHQLFASNVDGAAYQVLIANFERSTRASRWAGPDGILTAMDAAWKAGPA